VEKELKGEIFCQRGVVQDPSCEKARRDFTRQGKGRSSARSEKKFRIALFHREKVRQDDSSGRVPKRRIRTSGWGQEMGGGGLPERQAWYIELLNEKGGVRRGNYYMIFSWKTN